MFEFLKKKSENDLAILCDVGSAMVAASFVQFSSKQKPKILFTTFVPMSVMEEPDLTKLEDLVLSYAKQAFEKLSKEGLPEIKKKMPSAPRVAFISVSLASPWFASKTAERSITEKNGFIFDDPLIKTILNEEERTFETETLEKGLAYDTGKDIRMIERKVIGVSLNGYPTTAPIGKSAKRAHLSIYMSLAPEKVLESIRSAAHQYFPETPMQFHSFPLVSYGALEVLFPHEREYLFFDVAGEFTHLFVTKDGSIKRNASFASGRNALLREIQKGNGSPEIALSTLAVAKNANGNDAHTAEIRTSLDNFARSWSNACTYSIRSLNVTPIPKVWFVIADEEVQTFFTEYLKKIADTLTVPVTIIEIDHAHLEGKIEMEKHVERDCFLALQAIYGTIHQNRS